MFTKSIITTLVYLVIFHAARAQENAPVNFGKIDKGNFIINSPLVTENSGAVIIAEVGNVKFEGNSKGWFTYVYKVNRRIKILQKKSFHLADVNIYLYNNKQSEEKVGSISAASYTLENDQIVTVKLSSDNIYAEKTDKNHSVKKFTVPGVKEGSIIEYSYTVKSDFEFNLPAWEFQSVSAPTLWSEYNVSIPGLLNYMTVRQGYHDFYIDKAAEGYENYSIRRRKDAGSAYELTTEEFFSVSANTIKQRWVMKDLPALNIEDFVFSPGNFIDKMSLQLYRTYDGSEYHDVAANWKSVVADLQTREDFGLALDDPGSAVKKELASIADPANEKLQTAKTIYKYIQQNYTCTNRYFKYIKTSLADVVNKKAGTVGDINLLLGAMLKQKGIDAVPVLLSTRSFGYNSSVYPLMEKLNYTICRAKIDNKDYYLDATNPFLPFGKLPLECYNGHARVIAPDTMAVYFKADSVNEDKSSSVFIVNEDKKIMGTYKQQIGFFESLSIRSKIALSGLNSFKETISSNTNSDIELESITVDSLNLMNEPLSITEEFKVNSFGEADVVYFNPLLGSGYKKNPFYATERLYPVEMPYTSDEVFVFNMEVPEGYSVDELPKSVRIKLNEEDGLFEYLINTEDNKIQMRYRLLINRTIFLKEDYSVLRDFFGYVVKKQAEQIVFKKIK